MPSPVTFLMYDAYGRGGVARTVLTLANRLAADRPVRVVSLVRTRDDPRFELDPRVVLEVLIDRRPGRLRRWQRVLERFPTRMRPVPSERRLSLLTDLVLRRTLSRAEGIVVSTRPSLHLAATRWCPSGVRTVGQDHKNFATRFDNGKQAVLLREVVPRLDRYVVLTHADAEDYRRELTGSDTPIEVIRNALPWPVASAPAALEAPVVVAAGRLVAEKGWPRLIRAFAPVARDHPDWQLHIYGQGQDLAALTARIRAADLQDQVLLRGFTSDFHSVLSQASVYAMASRAEGFPMVLIEAMSVGLPLVAFDCPRGPGEIVVDGSNGFLVEDGDLTAFTAALRLLVEDEAVRRRCGEQALQDAHQYTEDSILAEWRDLLAGLDA